MTKRIRDFFNGVAFGITETVPGVSGGTIAIILGFYDELIKTVNHFTKDLRNSLLFFVPLILGAITGILTFSSIINYLLENHSFPTMLFFIGLIVGIIPIIFYKVRDPNRLFDPQKILTVAVPMLFLIILSNLKGVTVTDHAEVVRNISLPFMAFIFFAGILGAAALIIPGVSGSFVLLLLGIYPLVIYSISSIRFLLTDMTNVALMLDIGKVLGPLAVGIIIGGLSMARLIERLLQNHYTATYSIILGLLLGSVWCLLNEPMVYHSGTSTMIIIAGVITFLCGFAISFKLGKNRL